MIVDTILSLLWNGSGDIYVTLDSIKITSKICFHDGDIRYGKEEIFPFKFSPFANEGNDRVLCLFK